jgi:hypothetical protein
MVEDIVVGAPIGTTVRGSAFVIDAASGLLVTAKHVVADVAATTLRVRSVYTVDGNYALGLVNTVRAVYLHDTKDLAILRVSPRGTRRRQPSLETRFAAEVGDRIAVLGYGSGTDLVFCDEILGVGSPKSLTPICFQGAVAALVPEDGRPVELLVYDATTFPGNSGGPVVSLESEHVLALHLRSASNQVGYGLPLSECVDFLAGVRGGTVTPTGTPAHEPGDESTTKSLMQYIDWEREVERRSSEALGDSDVQGAIMAALDIQEPTDLLEWEWSDGSDRSLESAVAYLKGSRDARPLVLLTITLPESIIPDGVPRKLEEVRLKAAGEIWEIHQNDPDPRPSNPHAHNAETRLKLDLSTGDLYRKTTLVGRVKKKDLYNIREKAATLEIALPRLLV